MHLNLTYILSIGHLCMLTNFCDDGMNRGAIIDFSKFAFSPIFQKIPENFIPVIDNWVNFTYILPVCAQHRITNFHGGALDRSIKRGI